MENVYIVLIIVVGIILLALLFRNSLFVSNKSKDDTDSKSYSVDISGNETFGKTKVKVERDNVRMTANKLKGDTDINVSLSEQSAAIPSPTSNPPSQSYLPESSGQTLKAELITEHQPELEQQ